MRVALVYPPTCDPTAPYLAVPMLAGFLRANGVEVVPVDANVEAWDDLLEPGPMAELGARLEARLGELDRRRALGHGEQIEYAALARARGDARAVPDGVREAKAILRDPKRFFDAETYASAVATIEAATRVVSATHHGGRLHVDFTAYRTPFGLLSMDEVARASEPENDPFALWVDETLAPRLREAKVDVVGLSVCFPGQLQPAYAFASRLKRALPDVHVTCGGPGITQMLIRLSGQRLAHALGPFDSACVYEGERTLLALCRALDEGRPLREVPNVVVRDKLMGARWLSGHGMEDLKALPSPDFDGMPLDRYLAPRLVLPYDPTRGCYWGKCTFCHYGLAEVGTAAYRERDVACVVEHLRALSEKYGTKHFYFSQDSVAPKMIVKLAQAIIDAGLQIHWATDLKPEKYLTPERAAVLRKAGAVACALGVESGNERVLRLIDKGAPPAVVSDVIDRLSGAGIAAEAMCFTEFPTETHEEACETLDFLAEHEDKLAVYIVGEFGLTHGSLVAQAPEKFGIKETWELEGDRLGLGIFFEPATPWKSDEEREDVDARLSELSSAWALRTYPWAGAVSTAHTVLYYERFGPSVFRDLAVRERRGGPRERVLGVRRFEGELAFDPNACDGALAREAAIWATLVNDQRRVGRDPYEALVRTAPRVERKPMRLRFEAGKEPVRLGLVAGKRGEWDKRVPGRRPSHASNATRS